MAKATTTKKKAKSVNLGDGVKIKIKAKDGKKGGKSKAGNKRRSSDHNPIEALARLAESPIVADLIAIGATAAVAALANRGDVKGNAAKNAGKAAAAAIGARLMSEFNAVKASAKDAAAKGSAKKA